MMIVHSPFTKIVSIKPVKSSTDLLLPTPMTTPLIIVTSLIVQTIVHPPWVLILIIPLASQGKAILKEKEIAIFPSTFELASSSHVAQLTYT